MEEIEQHPLYEKPKRIYIRHTLDWYMDKYKLLMTSEMRLDLVATIAQECFKTENSTHRFPRGEG